MESEPYDITGSCSPPASKGYPLNVRNLRTVAEQFHSFTLEPELHGGSQSVLFYFWASDLSNVLVFSALEQ